MAARLVSPPAFTRCAMVIFEPSVAGAVTPWPM
jgi:hypothetical protein